jgi:hypothetical protein
MLRTWVFSTCLAAFLAPLGSATVIVSNTAGTLFAGPLFFGQAFTTPAGPSYSNISFNFFTDVPATTPAAAGILYLFTSAYSGTPAGLSSAGALAHSTSIVAGAYAFDPSVTLLPGTQYFVYSDTSITHLSGANVIAGSQLYSAPDSSTNFAAGSASRNFAVSGTTVPEPGSFTIALPVITAVLFGLRRRKSARHERRIGGQISPPRENA